MSSVVRQQFRPTVIVFVGESGSNICAHLLALGRLLPVEFHDGVGLLEVDEAANRVRLRAGARPDVPAQENIELAQAVRGALRGAQAERTVRAIQRAGHAVPVPHAQIYVVGHTASQAFPDILDVLAAELAETRIPASVSYLLSDVPPNPDRLPSWRQHLYRPDGDMPHANFCYLYEEIGHHNTFHPQQDIEYAAAEALFALVATAVHAAPIVQHATQKGLGVTDVDMRIGSLGTSLIAFPRAEVERYCTDLLGAELMQNWTESGASAAGDALDIQRTRAVEDMEAVFRLLADADERPRADGRLWPSLSALKDARPAEQLEKRTDELFAAFDYDAVMEDCARSGDAWRAVAQRREGSAILAFHLWEQVARKAWLAAGAEMEQHAGKVIDELWLADDQGASAALAYVERVDEGIQRLRERLINWRLSHANEYASDLAELDARSRGPWLDTPTASTPPGGSTFAIHVASSRLPAREQEVVARMERKVTWAEEQLPSLLSLIAVCVMAIPPLVLLLLDALPNGWGVQAPIAVLATLLVAVGAGGACWLLRGRAEERVFAARDDLLSVYRRQYTYRCERREDELRVVVLGPFFRRMQRVRERLEHMQGFVGAMRQRLLADAHRTRDALFDGPAGHRDVFVANGERLTKDGSYTLDDLYAEISRRRQSTVRESEAWHRSPDRMIAALRRWLRQQDASFLDLPDDEVEAAIRAFAAEIIRAYLVAELADLRPALAARGERRKGIWHEALGRSHVLFRPHTSPQPSVLICGRDEHRAALEGVSPHADAVHVRTQHPDWLLVAQFCPGGALTKWSKTAPDVLPRVEASEASEWSGPVPAVRADALVDDSGPLDVAPPGWSPADGDAVIRSTRPKWRGGAV